MSSTLQCTAPSPSPPNPPLIQSTERLRICIRRLPSSLSREDFLAFLNQALDKEANAIMNSTAIYYRLGNSSKFQSSTNSFLSAVFISFQSLGDLNRFYSLVNGKALNGDGYIPIIEYAPIQSFPPTAISLKVKKDTLEGTIEEDEYFLAFVEELTQKLPPGKDTASMRAEKMGPEIFLKSRPNQRAFKLDLSREGPINDPSKPVLRRLQLAILNPRSASSNITLSNPENMPPSKEDDIVLRAQQMAEEAKLKYSEAKVKYSEAKLKCSEASTKIPGQKKPPSRKPSPTNLQTQIRKQS